MAACGIDDAFDVKYVCMSGLSNAMNTIKSYNNFIQISMQKKKKLKLRLWCVHV